MGVLAIGRVFRRRCGFWRHTGRRHRSRNRDHRVSLGRVASPFCGAGTRRRNSGYHDISRYPHARQLPGLVLFRWDAPLFFANAEFFKERALDAVAKAPTPVRWLVVAAEPVTSVDVTAADALSELNEALREMGVKLAFAELKDPVKDKLKRFGIFDQFGEGFFFATIGAAVDAYQGER
jgi:MFS superfamily sulfate permease-like transporter